MKTATWEPSAGNLLAFLNSSTEFLMVDLYVIFNAGGLALANLTNGEMPVTVNGTTYSLGAKIDRANTSVEVGIPVAHMNVDIYAEPSLTLAGIPFVQAVAGGILDNGRIRVQRLFYNSAKAMQGTVMIFEGAVGQIISNRGHVQIEVVSDTQMLDVLLPSAVYQPSCRNTFCDQNCSLNLASYTTAGTVSAAVDATNQSFVSNFGGQPPAAAGYLSLGIVRFTGGANSGLSKTVKIHTGTGNGLVQLSNSVPGQIVAGDTFAASAGCDKTMATCQGKFGNLANFSAEPFIPLPQTVT